MSRWSSRSLSMPRLAASLVVVAVLVAVLMVGAAATQATADGRAVEHHDPVLLVHGFDGSAKSWRVMTARLHDAGYGTDEVAAVSYDSAQPNASTAHEIARAVDELLATTGASRVDLVSHSMGAISTRMYVEQLGGDAHVDAWVSLGGVNTGTVWAYGCAFLPSCREMTPGSAVLDDLAGDFRADGAVRFATWWSRCDLAIVPPGAATITGARNTETACLGHSELKTDAGVFGEVLRFVDDAHRRV